MHKKKQLLFAGIFILFIVGWIILLQFVNLQDLVQSFGIRNTYVTVFILAVIVGGSSFTAGPYYVILGSIATTGLSIPLLALLSGAGGMVGDTIYYYFGRTSSEVFSDRAQKILGKVNSFLQHYPALTPLVVFLYAAFMPMPNDLMTVSLGLSKYSYKHMAIPLFLGNIVFFYLLLTVSGNLFSFVSFLN